MQKKDSGNYKKEEIVQGEERRECVGL
ncbi:hypothetical protein CALK_1571 [Chitinivibrio alkaliphilus ACht1]|uniref:Uncharacterized protein n=1 Tax=Chitinivibrio alkaliphilus ACht1 TaxID=1313304 RepID=U7D7G9_9BACT|nr:hypothetical protein CALK_1571 [Chitinivibrio alkaliphilus ACht1]